MLKYLFDWITGRQRRYRQRVAKRLEALRPDYEAYMALPYHLD